MDYLLVSMMMLTLSGCGRGAHQAPEQSRNALRKWRRYGGGQGTWREVVPTADASHLLQILFPRVMGYLLSTRRRNLCAFNCCLHPPLASGLLGREDFSLLRAAGSLHGVARSVLSDRAHHVRGSAHRVET